MTPEEIHTKINGYHQDGYEIAWEFQNSEEHDTMKHWNPLTGIDNYSDTGKRPQPKPKEKSAKELIEEGKRIDLELEKK
jgi:hypothetical protein